MIEHRLFTRFKVEGEGLIQYTAAKPETVRVELVDMSFRGFGVYSPKPIEGDTKVKFYFSGEKFERHLRGEGKVMYSQKYRHKEADVFRMGVEFISVDSNQVRDMLESLRQEQSGKFQQEKK